MRRTLPISKKILQKRPFYRIVCLSYVSNSTLNSISDRGRNSRCPYSTYSLTCLTRSPLINKHNGNVIHCFVPKSNFTIVAFVHASDKQLRGSFVGGLVDQQSNQVKIEHSHVKGSAAVNSVNNFVVKRDSSQLSPTVDPSQSPSEAPMVPTEMPTEIPTVTEVPSEAPTEMPTEMPTELPSAAMLTAIPTAMPTFPPPSGNASYGCSGIRTEVVERVVPITQRIWMDRNLVSSRTASSIDDSSAYGCLYQWGRGLDGHGSVEWASSTSGTGVTGTTPRRQVPDPYPACADDEPFVINSVNWLDSSNDTLWETGSPRDPCPEGYQVPSRDEWEAEQAGIGGLTDGYDTTSSG